ncbi:hypothetical protein F7725_017616, partial [Dissostichus mawsoni]
MTGLALIIGFRRTAHFFFQRQKFRGSFFFLGGVTLVLCRWAIIGMLVESYGFVLLFRSFFPMALGFLLSAVNIPFLSAVPAPPWCDQKNMMQQEESQKSLDITAQTEGRVTAAWKLHK